MEYVDLHLHSTASDGTVRPGAVVREAADAGLAGLALTDHDTVAGLGEAREEATRLGLRFLPGAEISANEPGTSVHVLAYGFDEAAPELREFLATFGRDRVRRAREMVERLEDRGVPLGYAAVEEEAGEGVPTRAHVARALVRAGHVPTVEAAFGRFLARGRPAFVEKRPTPPAEVFDLVHRAGGVALLAHPGRDHGADEIRRWAAEGLDGVEVRHPSHDERVRGQLERLARDEGLLRTGGSDWHGDRLHKAAPGSQEVPVAWLDAIERRCRQAVAEG